MRPNVVQSTAQRGDAMFGRSTPPRVRANRAAKKATPWWQIILAYLGSFIAVLGVVAFILAWFVTAAMKHWLWVVLLAVPFAAILPLGFKDLKGPLQPRQAFGAIALMSAIIVAVF